MQKITYNDDGTYYSSISPSLEEWRRTFGPDQEHHYGPLHLWMRCVGDNVRGYYFLEAVEDNAGLKLHLVQERDKILSRNLTILADGVPLETKVTGAGGEFYLNIGKTAKEIRQYTEIHITVQNWLRYSKFPLSQCTEIHFPVGDGESNNDGNGIAKPLRLVMHTYMMDESESALTDFPKMAHAMTIHALYHKCAIGLAKYEVAEEREHIPLLLAYKPLAALAQSDYVEFVVKGNSPTQVQGKTYKWQLVYMNLAILRHWSNTAYGVGYTRLLLWDLDEFLHLHSSVYTTLDDIIRSHPVVNFQRKSTICSDCDNQNNGGTDFGYGFKGHKYVQSDTHVPTKVVINPDESGCVLVHFSLCTAQHMRLDSRIAYIVHLENYFSHRYDLTDPRLQFKPKDISELYRCEPNITGIDDYNTAGLKFEASIIQAKHFYGDRVVSIYFENELVIFALGVLCILVGLIQIIRQKCKGK